MRVGILTSHPIQYQAPYFRALATHVDLHVYFAHRPNKQQQGAGFGTAFEWDVNLLSGYCHAFLHNVARQPGSDRFRDCDTPEIAEIIARETFDAFIVSGWYLKSYWQAIRACRKKGIPVLVRGDSQLHTPRSLFKRCYKQIVHRLALRHFSAFLTVGHRNRDYLLHYGIPEGRIFFAPHFVDNNWFAERATSERITRRQTRARWGASDATLVVLFVGKFIPKKRPADVLHAVARLKETHGETVIVFVGSGELDAHLREVAKKAGVNVVFEGFRNQTELPRYYSSADVLVLPSDGGETWGLVVNEGMACGLPAIVSDAVGCAPDLIDDGRTGFEFPAGDLPALSAALRTMAELNKNKFDFQPALEAKLRLYSLETAVAGTIMALRIVSPTGTREPAAEPCAS